MKKNVIAAVLITLFSALFPIVVRADEISNLKQQLTEQTKKLQELQEKMDKLESGQKQQDKVIEDKISKVMQEKKIEPWPGSLDWVKNIKINGDLRYRYEMIDEEGSDNRNRNRIRASSWRYRQSYR